MGSSIYRTLLRLYPAHYRAEFGKQMADVVDDMLADAPNGGARMQIWFRIVADYPLSLATQHLAVAAVSLHHETPNYVKRNGLVAGLLLVPFVVALAANGLNKAITGQTLYHSWLWSTPVLTTWVGWLPQTAMLLAFITWIAYIWGGRRAERLARAFDVYHAWPIMVAGVLAAGIIFMLLFHDSIHCWMRNPIQTATHFSQALQCSNAGFLGGRS